MIQQTSIKAFRNIRKIRGESQAEVYRTMKTNGGMTNMEIADRLGWSINRVTPRVFELREAGFVRKRGIVHCRITGNRCISWEVNI